MPPAKPVNAAVFPTYLEPAPSYRGGSSSSVSPRTPKTESDATVSRRTSSRYLLTMDPSYFEHDGYKFVIMGAPTNDSIEQCLEDMKANNVTAICRLCKPTYAPAQFTSQNITVVGMPFADGNPPTKEILETFLIICRKVRKQGKSVAVHCIGGLGRAPALVAMALMELCGLNAKTAIAKIRSIRRGAINARQYEYLMDHKPTRKYAKKNSFLGLPPEEDTTKARGEKVSCGAACAIM